MADSELESRPTSPDMLGYTSAGDEAAAASGDASATGATRKTRAPKAKENIGPPLTTRSRSAVQPEPASENGRGSSQLPTHREGTEDTHGRGAVSTASSVSSASEQEIEDCYDRLDAALLSVEDELLTYRGLRLDKRQLQEAVTNASTVLKVIQDCHRFLRKHDAKKYAETVEQQAAAGRREISGLLPELREQLAAASEQPATTTGAAAPVAAAPEAGLQDRARYRAVETVRQLRDVANGYKELANKNPADDDQLFELIEQFKLHDAHASSTINRAGQVATLALSCQAYDAEMDVQTMINKLEDIKLEAQKVVIKWRGQSGLWAEQSQRAIANRTLLTMPRFSGAPKDKTVYEFIAEWTHYKTESGFSVNEALKALKEAVGEPAKSAVKEMATEAAIFDHLKRHYGNALLLLSNREQEMREWKDCKGTSSQVKEWLLHAKTKLEATFKLCEEHSILQELHYSGVVNAVRGKFDAKMSEKFDSQLLKQIKKDGSVPTCGMIKELIRFLDEQIDDVTAKVTLELARGVNSARADPATPKSKDAPQPQRGGQSKQAHAAQQGQQDGAGSGKSSQAKKKSSGAKDGNKDGKKINPKLCVACGQEHPALFYCQEFIEAALEDRFEIVKEQQTCSRCLSMGRKFMEKKQDWWPNHEQYCKTKFFCSEGTCSKKPKNRQFHITLCRWHAKENKDREEDFKNSLDASCLPSGLTPAGVSFLAMLTPHMFLAGKKGADECSFKDRDGYEVEPDVRLPAIFMLQNIPAPEDPSTSLLCFYDSGASGAGISNRAWHLMDTITVRNGPTVLNVAGGKSLSLPHGDEQFQLELDTPVPTKATLTGLRMPHITVPFPAYELAEAWEEVQATVSKQKRKVTLPQIDEKVGGRSVDVLIGIQYLKYFPEPLLTLPSGLQVYRAKIKSASGRQAVLGGPHESWLRAVSQTQHMTPKVYLTSEAQAWYVGQTWVEINKGKFSNTAIEWEEEETKEEFISSAAASEEDQPDGGCSHCHCTEEAVEAAGVFSAAREEKDFWRVENLGTESLYRCISCRNCSKCRSGDTLEAVSLKEEAEQALIEASVELDPVKNVVWAKLPFIEDPVTNLKPNRFVAEKVLKTQLEIFKKSPGMRESALKSHKKLADKGHVVAEVDVDKDTAMAISKEPGVGYFIPWRIVFNESSISTPCRVVFDASSKTPGGESLNGVLAKGQNRLVALQYLMIRFRSRWAAVTADISMAYNGTKLRPEHYKYQKYLWKEDLLPENPTKVMYVATLIYGVKPSGQQCQVSLEKLAAHFREKGEYLEGADVLEKNTYVDDIMTSQDTTQECMEVACQIEKILERGSMGVKAFSFSREQPHENVSSDGVHVGLGGYLWATESDTIELDIGPARLGKAKRGKRPPAVTGDYKEALRPCFTRRVLTGLVHGVFDPLGLVTPITAGMKLDLHELCQLKLDWDDPVPEVLLEKWVANMEKIQALKGLAFQRTIIPADAADDKVELLVMTDASQNLGVVAVFGRVKRKNGQYSCQLIMGRSKLLTGMTIPKAELKSAVAAATTASVVQRNFGDRCCGVTFVTDSTICLYWITQDDRPLQVGVRNAVCEIRRFSDVGDWFHVTTEKNVADLGTRPASVAEIVPGSAWQVGQPWMWLSRGEMPIRSAAEITLTAEEKRQAAVEMRNKELPGVAVNLSVPAVADRYALSEYLVDPCRFPWSKAVRIMAMVRRFINSCRKKETGAADRQQAEVKVVILTPEELKAGENYFFLKATAEVKKFSAKKDYEHCSVEKEGVLHFSGRLLNTGQVKAVEEVMFDLNPVSFFQPIVDRHSPVAYSIMLETHWKTVSHLSAATTYRESLSMAYIIRGRDLAQEVRASCHFCRRYKARMVEVEMGKTHESRLVIAPPFTYCQVDLLGPYEARCQHNHRSTVKVWGVVFKDPASGAIFVHAMPKCDTEAFVAAYTRFAARFCHPMKLYPDEGSQLLKACKEMEISWVDVSTTLNARHQVGVEFEACPVGGHNFHGQVERSIREVKKLFDTVYKGKKLDIMGYETAFAWISNELNNLPLCLGSKYKDLDNLDLLTPNRLIHGRSNRRAMSGPCTVDKPSKMLEKMNEIFEAWWKAWHNEKLADFVVKPAKWFRSSPAICVGDIVVFQKKGQEQSLGTPIWTIGRVVKADPSPMDGKVRDITIEYKNLNESVFRTTHRAARSVAVLHKEGDLDLMQELSAASREATKALFMKEAQDQAYGAMIFEMRESVEASDYEKEMQVFAKECECVGTVDALCNLLKVHYDPWV